MAFNDYYLLAYRGGGHMINFGAHKAAKYARKVSHHFASVSREQDRRRNMP